ncbi:MAG: hypothetical protein U0930_21330 [Pirellulales bacterium]
MSENVDQQQDSQLSPAISWQPGLLVAIAACVIGGAVSFAVLFKLYPLYPLPELPELGQYPSAELIQQYHEAYSDFGAQNGAVDCAIIGGCMGLFFGLLTANGKRLVGSIAGAVSGVLSGAGIGFLIGRQLAKDFNGGESQSITLTTMYHFAVWGGICLIVFTVLSLIYKKKEISNAVAAAIVGGLFASAVYNVVSGIMFPTMRVSVPSITPPDLGHRLLWIACCSLTIGLCLGGGMLYARLRPATPKTASPNLTT